MKYLPPTKWLVLFLLLSVTLGWKVVARAAATEDLTAHDIQARVAEFLVRQHFNVSASEQAEEGKPSIAATAGSCRILVARSPAVGWDGDLIRRFAEADDHIFVVFRGYVYARQPTLSTVFDALWSRFRRELGMRVYANPVFAVVAKPSCEAERLPWIQLQVGGA